MAWKYLKRTIATITLATLLYLNCTDTQVRPQRGSTPREHMRMEHYNPEIHTGFGAENRFKNIPRPMADQSLDSLARESMASNTWIHRRNTLTDVSLWEDSISVNWSEDRIRSEFRKANKNDTLIFYRIRPGLNHARPVEYDRSKSNNFNYQFGPPNPLDIFLHLDRQPEYTGKFERKHLTVISRLFDGRGMWEYSVDKDVAKKAKESQEYYYDLFNKVYEETLIHKDSIFQRIPREAIRRDSVPEDLNSRNRPRPRLDSYGNERVIRREPPPYVLKKIDEYIKAMNQAGVKIKYIPSDSL